jgi:Domain of unknown function (DUF4424)
MKIISRITTAAIVAVSANVVPARANDTAAELSIGGLQFTRTSAVAMEDEALRISLDRVTVRYQFKNISAAPVDLTVAFPLPDIDLSEGESIAFPSNDPVNFVDFETKVDGSPVKFVIEQRATVGDKDVTSSLREYKVPVLPIGARQIRTQDLQEAIRTKMADDGLLLPAGSNEKGRPLYEPGWIVKTSAVRQQTFPAGRSVTVEHSYRPSVGGSSDTILRKGLRQNKAMAKEIERYRRDYCITDGFLAELDKVAGTGLENKAAVQERRISYVLKTGANWAGPIKAFRLAVDGGKGRLVSFCHAGLNPAPGGVSEFEAKDFVPTQNLKVLVVGKF